MTTHFITAEVEQQASPEALQEEIATQLKEQGEPLRWSITAVNEQTAQVEAVVLAD
ncbi:MAG: hypothetical protein ACFCU8_20345 [Thermosynechococcaceae cyanobacterium]